ncbi:hypothetical protein [Clostridium botulinum]|uniref:hypothetical protein n=1 Tax=Clostridium botulinum TaxID=1491 RepID=UPI001C9A9D7B|nr:hypothetical protein [Clostridium botulinum]MBY6900211.1 hypothetical protein [Clostridium botulinum]MBY6914324.1 hypothetical protein [Clostridium botulinum]
MPFHKIDPEEEIRKAIKKNPELAKEIEKAHAEYRELKSRKENTDKEIKKAIEYFNGYGSPYDELVISTLEKQAPKKVIRTKTISQACPVCKSAVNWKYCSNCGQRLTY